MHQILLVEDSLMFGRLAKDKIEKAFDVPVHWAKNFTEADNIIKSEKGNFSQALLDYTLPDAPNGEIIDRVTREGISSLVFTSNMTDEVRNHVWSKRVADYILKDDPNSLDYVITTMQQLEKNQNTLILVVDDSSTYRNIISELLYVQKFRVINASDGKKALGIIDQYPEVQLVITDFNMPGMDGCKLSQKIREKYKAEQMAIIGISSEDDRSLGAKFLKSGADDFIIKQTFLVEEFYSRVKKCIETLNLIEIIRERSIRDFLTGLYNRRYFFEAGNELYQKSHSSGTFLSCTMLDIDFFKKVNDTYGHDVGDDVIKNFATLLRDNSLEDEIVSRFGGEEFCILTPNGNKQIQYDKLDTLRKKVETTPLAILADGSEVFVTCSIGCCVTLEESLDTMIKASDDQLYKAKEQGRNRVEM